MIYSPKVFILLSTFNGEKYLDNQLESIWSQIGVTPEVYVTDDGSTDDTISILKKWEKIGLIKKIDLVNGRGASKNFLSMLYAVKDLLPVAFSDQDDIWEPNKLKLQLEMTTKKGPRLSCSRRTHIDENGTVIGASKRITKEVIWRNAIIENIAYGNTIFLNQEGVGLAKSFRNLDVFHYDSWLYLLFSVCGNVDYLDEPLTKYRIHYQNSIGIRKSLSLRKFLGNFRHYFAQSIFLADLIKSTPLNKNSAAFVSYVAEIQYSPKIISAIKILKSPVFRQSSFETMFAKILLVFVSNSKQAHDF
jgi:glycosyltransferase involved in cell wall biosynthesis